MSESTSAPAAPAAPPAGPPAAPVSAPAPASQPGISISEAGRILRQQRQANGEAPPAPATPAAPERKPSATELAREAAQKPPGAPAAAPAAPKRAETGLSAMEKALGVPGVVAPGVSLPEGTPPLQQTTTPTDGSFGEIVVEGQRLRSAEDVRAFAERKSADYTQKTQALAQQAQQLQAQQQALATVLPYIQPELQRLAQTLQNAETAQMPDPTLAQTDPTAYVQQRAAYDAAVAEQQRLGQLTVLQQQAAERAMAQQVAQANEQLANEFPFWADPAQRLEAQNTIVEWATSKGGFSRDELRGLADPRHLKLMMKAAIFDRWMDGARTTAPAPALAAPPRGTSPPPPPTARVAEAQQAFDAKPDVRRATALLSAMRGNGQAR